MPISRNSVSYETERLILKPTDIDDAEMILQLLNSEGWIENIGNRNVKSVEQAAAYIEEKMISQYNERGYGNYTVILKSTQEKMGTSGIYARPGQEDVDIGFALLPEYMGKGYSYEAAHKLMQLAQSDFGISKITAVTLPSNLPSRALIEKLGLKYSEKVIWDDVELLKYSCEF